MKLFPAIEGRVGTWKYYSTKMPAGDLAAQVKFASEVWDSKALDHWIQRSLNESRAKNVIAGYLASHDDRFFNSIVVAALEGNPKFFPVQITDDPKFELLDDDRMNESFGVLRFDGKQKYYALDGQHRLKAIKALLENETEFTKPPHFEDEEFSVIIVVQAAGESREEFMKKYRRLFSHLNRYAKAMDKATSIIMDEDDVFALCTRRLIQEHEFFGWFEDGSTRVRCEGSKNIGRSESYFTTIISLYEMNIALLFSNLRKSSDVWGEGSAKEKIKKYSTVIPDDDTIDELYSELCMYWDAILEEFPELREDGSRMRHESSMSVDEKVDGQVLTNHMLFRPIVQEQVFAPLVRERLDRNESELSEQALRKALGGLGAAPWRGYEAPWRNLVFVYDSVKDSWRMRGDDRKQVVGMAYRLLRWIVGIDNYPSEESLNESLRKNWEPLLLNASAEERETMWQEMKRQAERFR